MKTEATAHVQTKVNINNCDCMHTKCPVSNPHPRDDTLAFDWPASDLGHQG